MVDSTGEILRGSGLDQAPTPSPDTVDRQRLLIRLWRAFDASPYVEILAGRGWGKTTVAAQFAQTVGGPVAWVDGGAGSKALEPLLQLWDQGGGLDLTVVLDAAEQLLDEGEDGVAALTRLVAARPRGARVLLCSSRHLGAALEQAGAGTDHPLLTESDLRFTARDARRLPSAVAVADLLKDTGGWVAGAVLLAQGRHDPHATVRLHRLIRSAVLEGLPPTERAFLSHTAILPIVTQSDARALVGEEAEALVHSVRRRVLPLVHATGDALVYRRPLRELLLADLSSDDSTIVDDLSRRHLDHLQASGRMREAVEWCVAEGDRQGAVHVVERVVAGLANRTPAQEELSEWLQLLGPDTALASDVIAGAAIRRLHADRRTHEATTLIRRLSEDDRIERILRTNPDLHATVLWCLHERPKDALNYLSEEYGSYRIDAVSYMVSVLGGTEPIEAPVQVSWGELAALVHWGLIWQGRLDEVIDSATDSQSAFEDNPNVVIAALWTGRLDLAKSAWERIPAGRNERPQAQLARAAFLLAEGRLEEALEVLARNRAAAERAGQESTFDVLYAYVLIRRGEAARAIPHLTPRLPTMRGTGHRAIEEWARMVLGIAHLEAGDLDAAQSYLTDALASMRPAGRLLLAAAAERALAEVRLRRGSAAVDPAVDVAVAELVPDEAPAGLTGHVGSRFWEAEVAARTPLVEATLAQRRAPVPAAAATRPERSADPASAVLYSFGEPAVLEIGETRNVLRRTKLVELIADLALHGGAMDRDLLQARLFPDIDRRRASNYFRQVVFKIRELIGVSLHRDGALLVWPEEIPLRAVDIDFERRIEAIPGVDAEAGQVRDVFDLAAAPYLPASELPWVVERRNHLSLLYEKAVVSELHKAYDAGDLELIRDYGARAIAINPYAEDLYLLMIRAEQNWGSVARGRAMFRAAHESMKDLGIEVSEELRDAAQRLGATSG
ncbi:hypothetical protein P5P86_09975 [Nocardioides sp. BP30]|uniref:hypothetical protein n=1 Tax=Nocardioides sp. BP30 TaxID=3036374 RepID=UPI0024697023|nr:hypothetical protein [Nocardioides sp. BP30]WGL54139.1 hypothetical protein P5P86_09975 [Nocardioides sp. BP30]